MHPSESRDLWHLIETVHAVTYFSPVCRQAHSDLGFKGFWMGYFGTRAAPMGAVTAPVVTAAFAGFEPSMVSKAIPDAWSFVEPEAAVTGRAEAAARALRITMPDCEDLAESVLGVLDKAIEGTEPSGRALFAANQAVMPFEDPVEDLWQMCTTLREHRGDGHVASLTAEGVGGCEAHVLALAARADPPKQLFEARGWADQDWTDALTTLKVAGIVSTDAPDSVQSTGSTESTGPTDEANESDPHAGTPAGPAVAADLTAMFAGLALTERGARLHAHLESRTDELASAPYAAIGEVGRDHLRDGLIPLASAVNEAGWIPYPNPIGLPEVV